MQSSPWWMIHDVSVSILRFITIWVCVRISKQLSGYPRHLQRCPCPQDNLFPEFHWDLTNYTRDCIQLRQSDILNITWPTSVTYHRVRHRLEVTAVVLVEILPVLPLALPKPKQRIDWLFGRNHLHQTLPKPWCIRLISSSWPKFGIWLSTYKTIFKDTVVLKNWLSPESHDSKTFVPTLCLGLTRGDCLTKLSVNKLHVLLSVIYSNRKS